MSTVLNGALWLGRNIIWINIFLAGAVVFFERRNPKSTWLWLMVLTFLPGVGFILYLVLGQDLSKEKKFKEKQEVDLQVDHIAIDQRTLIDENKYKFTSKEYLNYVNLIKMNLRSSNSLLTEDNDLQLYFEGEEKFKALIDEINRAEKYILLQYYIIKSDGLGMRVIDALCKKAEEGVNVKVLYDGMGGRNLSKEAIKKMKDSGIKTAVFFPPFASRFTLRINYRNHRKICVVDGRVGFVGGFNIGDEYIGLYKKFGHWRDTHLKIEGSAVKWLQ